jgi:maltoporin
VGRGSRLDESNYVELELRREDTWSITNASTRIVATLAISNPIFHYNGNFDVAMALRNLYIEAKGLITPAFTLWAGSRMYRGDDIYLVDWWPLDSLNTLGAGAKYNFAKNTSVALHGGVQQPDSAFFQQNTSRPPPGNGFGSYNVEILDRQKFIGSLKATHIFPLGPTGGVKAVAYAEAHALPSGQKETDPGVFQKQPGDGGFVLGAQVGLFTGQRDTHVNLYFRYAAGLPAYGEFASPFALSLDRKTSGAHDVRVAIGSNWEQGPFGLLSAAYVRSFRNASPDLDFDDVDEAIIIARPQVFFGQLGGIALEASHQIQQRGVLTVPGQEAGGVPPPGAPEGPTMGQVTRFGLVPFFSPAGRGSFSRPQLRLIYVVSLRNEAARSFYAQDDVFNLRSMEHFFGVGAEWWFNSSYGG